MTYTPPLPCLALIRVSTQRQQDDEQALDNQAARLRDPGAGIAYKPVMIYEEIASARGARSLESREDLQQVWREAHQQGVPLMVTSASRLSRHRQSFEQKLREMPIDVIVLDEGGLVSHDRLLELISEAEANGDKITEGTSRYVKDRIAAGRSHGSVGTQSKAGRKSGEVRAAQKHDKHDELVDFLDRNPSFLGAKLPAVLKALNDLQIWTVRGEPWTADALRKKLQTAKQELLDRRQMEIEIDAEPYDPGMEIVSVEVGTDVCINADEDLPDQHGYRTEDHPDFERFGQIENSALGQAPKTRVISRSTPDFRTAGLKNRDGDRHHLDQKPFRLGMYDRAAFDAARRSRDPPRLSAMISLRRIPLRPLPRPPPQLTRKSRFSGTPWILTVLTRPSGGGAIGTKKPDEFGEAGRQSHHQRMNMPTGVIGTRYSASALLAAT